jgi:hypothetical protein
MKKCPHGHKKSDCIVCDPNEKVFRKTYGVKPPPSLFDKKNHRKEWGKQTVHMGDFIHWLQFKKFWLRGVDSISPYCKCVCFKCPKKHYSTGWSWVQTTMCMSVCDEQIKKDIPPKTADEWEAWGR